MWGTAEAVDELVCSGCLRALGKRFPWFLTKPGGGLSWAGSRASCASHTPLKGERVLGEAPVLWGLCRQLRRCPCSPVPAGALGV